MEANYPPFIIPVFLPHSGCPHQCAFCNQKVITSVENSTFLPENLSAHIENYLTYRREKKRSVQIAFFGGNFLGLKNGYIDSLLKEAEKLVKAGKVDSIRFSTRPDTITHENLELIKDYPVSTIELGVQSMDDEVLAMSNRGHTSHDTRLAVSLLKKNTCRIGIQMMVGLPGDTNKKSLNTGRQIVDLKPDFVRIYPTVVLSGSPLAKTYKEGHYSPLFLENCVSLVKDLYLLFSEKNISVIRMGLQASEDLDNGAAILAGPYHPAFGHLVFSEIFFDKASSILEHRHLSTSMESITIKVHPKSISKMRGLKNRNIQKLKAVFNISAVHVVADESLEKDAINIE